MTEHVQLEIIAAIVLVSGQIIAAWRVEMVARGADQKRDELKQGMDNIHDTVNGKFEAAQATIAELREKIIRLEKVIAERK